MRGSRLYLVGFNLEMYGIIEYWSGLFFWTLTILMKLTLFGSGVSIESEILEINKPQLCFGQVSDYFIGEYFQ